MKGRDRVQSCSQIRKEPPQLELVVGGVEPVRASWVCVLCVLGNQGQFGETMDLDLGLAVGRFGGASQGKEKALPVYSVSLSGVLPLWNELHGPRAVRESPAWFLHARGSRTCCRPDRVVHQGG